MEKSYRWQHQSLPVVPVDVYANVTKDLEVVGLSLTCLKSCLVLIFSIFHL